MITWHFLCFLKIKQYTIKTFCMLLKHIPKTIVFAKPIFIGNICCYLSFHRNLKHLPSMNIIAVISFPFRVLTQQLQYKDRCNALDDFTVSLNKDKQVLLSTCLRVHMHAIFHVSCVLGDLF